MKTLSTSLEIPIRFSETDAMGVVWHGNYLKFFEDGREYFGKVFGIEYLDIHAKGFFIPIVKSEINHKASVYYGQKIKVEVTLEFHLASKIVFTYLVINSSTGEIAATGSTIQVFLSVENRQLELVKPDFYLTWENNQNWHE